MRTTSRLVVALTLAVAAGSAYAQSPIPGNNVTDFGPFHYSNPTSPPDRPVFAAHIAGNNIDDFGSLVPETYVAEEELGAAGAEPGLEVKTAERAQEKAAIKAYAQERFLRETWANP